jgi:hypothetical protein
MSTAHRPVTEKRKNNHKSIKDTKEKKREGVGGKISKVPKFFFAFQVVTFPAGISAGFDRCTLAHRFRWPRRRNSILQLLI